MKKNLKLFALLALSATLCLSSCKKDELPPTPPVDPDVELLRTITLRMSLPTSAETRGSVGASVTSVGALIGALDVYFYDAASGFIVYKQSLTTAEVTAITGAPGFTFPNLTALVNAVAIVGNNDANKGITAPIAGNMSTIFGHELDAQYEQDFANVTFYGKGETLTSYTPASPDAGVDYYAANITIRPLVARMEVRNIECTSLVSNAFPRFHLQSVVMDNIYQRTVLDTETFVPASLFASTAAQVEAKSTPSPWWAYNYVASDLDIPNATGSSGETPFNPGLSDPTVDGQGGDGVFAFHFIPDGNPWVRLYVQNQADNVKYYVNIKTFAQNGIDVGFQSGRIYKMNVPFLESSVTSHNDNLKNIQLNVTVQDWTIVDDVSPDIYQGLSVDVNLGTAGSPEMIRIADRNAELGPVSGATIDRTAANYGYYYNFANSTNGQTDLDKAYKACFDFREGNGYWRLPTEDEMNKLLGNSGGSHTDNAARIVQWNGTAWHIPNENTNQAYTSTFMPMGGYKSGSTGTLGTTNVGTAAYFLTSTLNGAGTHWSVGYFNNTGESEVYGEAVAGASGFSVRCVRTI